MTHTHTLSRSFSHTHTHVHTRAVSSHLAPLALFIFHFYLFPSFVVRYVYDRDERDDDRTAFLPGVRHPSDDCGTAMRRDGRGAIIFSFLLISLQEELLREKKKAIIDGEEERMVRQC